MSSTLSLPIFRKACRHVSRVERTLEVDRHADSAECFKRVRGDLTQALILARKLTKMAPEMRAGKVVEVSGTFIERLESLLVQLENAISVGNLEGGCQISREIHCCVASLMLIAGGAGNQILIERLKQRLTELLKIQPTNYQDILYARNIAFRRKSIEELEQLAKGKVLDFALGMFEAAIQQVSYVVQALEKFKLTRNPDLSTATHSPAI